MIQKVVNKILTSQGARGTDPTEGRVEPVHNTRILGEAEEPVQGCTGVYFWKKLSGCARIGYFVPGGGSWPLTQFPYGNGCGFWLRVDPTNQLEPGSCFLAGSTTVVHVHNTFAEFGGFRISRAIVKGRYARDIEAFQEVLQLCMSFGIWFHPVGDHADGARRVSISAVTQKLSDKAASSANVDGRRQHGNQDDVALLEQHLQIPIPRVGTQIQKRTISPGSSSE